MPPMGKQGWSVSLEPGSTPVYGGEVGFDITHGDENPWVKAEAYVDGVLVYAQWHGYFEGYYAGTDPRFQLGPTRSWPTSSPADGVAVVGYWTHRGTFREMARTEFDIAG